MEHLRMTLLGDAALARAVTVLAARGIAVEHLHVEGAEACALVSGERAGAVLGRLVDLRVDREGHRCLAPATRTVVVRQPPCIVSRAGRSGRSRAPGRGLPSR